MARGRRERSNAACKPIADLLNRCHRGGRVGRERVQRRNRYGARRRAAAAQVPASVAASRNCRLSRAAGSDAERARSQRCLGRARECLVQLGTVGSIGEPGSLNGPERLKPGDRGHDARLIEILVDECRP